MTKRDAMLAAADRLFARDGFGLTGVDALVSAAGVTKRTLYKTFGSKAGLFAAWLDVRDQRTRLGLKTAIEARTDDPREQLLVMFDMLAGLATRDHFHGCPFARALVELEHPRDVAARAVAVAHKAALTDWFLDRLRAAGIADPATTAEEVSVLYEGVLQRIAATRRPDAAYAARRMLAARLYP